MALLNGTGARKFLIRILPFILVLFSPPVHSQDSAFWFSSTVLDAQTGKPVPFATVSYHGTLRKTISDEKGRFRMLVNKKRSVISVTSPSHSPTYLSVPTLIRPADLILLQPLEGDEKNEMIPGAEAVFDKEGHHVIDYAFADSFLLVLSYEVKTGKYHLVSLTRKGELQRDMIVGGKPTGFFVNCRNESFLMKEESASEIIFRDGKVVSLGKEREIRKFEKEFLGCVAEDAANTYYAFTIAPDYILNSSLDLKVLHRALSYISISKEKKQRSLFKNLSVPTTFQKDEKTHLELNMNRLPFSSQKINFQEVYSPLFRTGNRMVLFDLAGGKVENYDSTGRMISSALIFFHRNETWTGKIYFDQPEGKFYTGFYRDGKIELNEIDTGPGKLKKAKTLMPLENNSDLKVIGNFIYYLKSSEKGNRIKLFRNKL